LTKRIGRQELNIDLPTFQQLGNRMSFWSVGCSKSPHYTRPTCIGRFRSNSSRMNRRWSKLCWGTCILPRPQHIVNTATAERSSGSRDCNSAGSFANQAPGGVDRE